MIGGLVVDNFAGGGGASTGIRQAIGRDPDIAVNHDYDALVMYRANHPNTKVYWDDVFKVDPLKVTAGRPVDLAWFSPDCTHFSKAKGGKPKSKKIRGLAWVMVKWAAKVRPRLMFLENVEEFQTWGPLLEDGKACPERKGRTFRTLSLAFATSAMRWSGGSCARVITERRQSGNGFFS
jgi:DNA (cytosine-5)-methyltransferase 1